MVVQLSGLYAGHKWKLGRYLPVMLLNFSILLLVFGLVALLRARAIQAGGQLLNNDVRYVRTPGFLQRALALDVDLLFVGSFAGFGSGNYVRGILFLTTTHSKMRPDFIVYVLAQESVQ